MKPPPAKYLTCAHDCPGNHAHRYPIVCMVAQGHARGEHDPVRLICFAPICKHCRRHADVQDYLPRETRKKLAACLRGDGKAPPDFDHAWLEFGTIGDRDWRSSLASDGEVRH